MVTKDETVSRMATKVSLICLCLLHILRVEMYETLEAIPTWPNSRPCFAASFFDIFPKIQDFPVGKSCYSQKEKTEHVFTSNA